MNNKFENYKKGKEGEEIAKKFLEDKGMVWIESNYENKIGEIDLIFIDEKWLVFVEVKYKTNDRLGIPEEMISQNKINQIKRVAESYIYLFHPKQEKFRIDAVCILGPDIKYYPNIGG